MKNSTWTDALVNSLLIAIVVIAAFTALAIGETILNHQPGRDVFGDIFNNAHMVFLAVLLSVFTLCLIAFKFPYYSILSGLLFIFLFLFFSSLKNNPITGGLITQLSSIFDLNQLSLSLVVAGLFFAVYPQLARTRKSGGSGRQQAETDDMPEYDDNEESEGADEVEEEEEEEEVGEEGAEEFED